MVELNKRAAEIIMKIELKDQELLVYEIKINIKDAIKKYRRFKAGMRY